MTHEELRQLRFAVTDYVWDKLKEEGVLSNISDDFWDWFDEVIEKPLMRLICDVEGHSPTRDMCGKPEHDYCAICQLSMPGAGFT